MYDLTIAVSAPKDADEHAARLAMTELGKEFGMSEGSFQMRNAKLWLALTALIVGTAPLSVRGELTELAFYHLGEDDAGATAGSAVSVTVDSIEGRDMETFGEVFYSDDTPPGTNSRLSARFTGDIDSYLATEATAWHTLYPGFRVGMEAWIKADPSMEGMDSVPFGDGTGYHLGIDPDGYPQAYAGARGTVPGDNAIEYGKWQHVAFWTTGSFWQVYLNGEPQLDPLDEFNYGSPSGLATLGADKDGFSEFTGLIDEHRVFTWTGAFDPGDLLFYSQRAPGDVNEDGMVDQIDYDIWRTNVGADLTGVSLLEGRGLGDLNTDRQINLDDFALIKANKTPGALLQVPEPAAAVLLLVGTALVAIGRHRRVA